MIYIVTALKSEAQAFVDKFRLQKMNLATYTLYTNDAMRLIVSGVGVDNARLATQMLINTYDLSDEDIFYNVGVCAAPSHHPLGTLLNIGTVVYDGISYPFDKEGITLQCSDTPQNTPQNTPLEIPVDMESFGFYDAVIHNPAIKHFGIFKVVSDHFEPDTLSKDMVKSLLFQKIDEII